MGIVNVFYIALQTMVMLYSNNQFGENFIYSLSAINHLIFVQFLIICVLPTNVRNLITSI